MAVQLNSIRSARIFGLCLALCLHAGAAAALLHQALDPSDFAEDQGLMLTMELAPSPMAQAEAEPGEQAPDSPEAAGAQGAPPTPTLEEKLSTTAASDQPTAENTPYEPPPDALARKETEKRDETRPEEKEATNAQTPEQAEPATAAAAPSISGAVVTRDDSLTAANREGAALEARETPQSWQRAVVQHLAKHKRYPRAARNQKAEGEVTVEFTVSGEGRVSAARLVMSSGADLLDEETLAMLARAQPLPMLPAGMGSRGVRVVLPVRYKLR